MFPILASFASGHIVLETPKPFKFLGYGPSNPLDPTGFDWPCKIPGGSAKLEIDGAPTPMQIGQPQILSFKRGNGAVHGGGSCQLSLLPGFAPSRSNADFRTILSIEGGCPTINQEGNLNDGQYPSNYTFTIPPLVPTGYYTLSWSWVNRIGGSPEFYQNCAPISVSGGVKISAGSLQDLPPMFMANIGEPSQNCLTKNALVTQQAIQYPSPGSVVDQPEGTSNLIKVACHGNPLAGSAPNSPALVSSSIAKASDLSSTPSPSLATPSMPLVAPSRSSKLSTSVIPTLQISNGISLAKHSSSDKPSLTLTTVLTPAGQCTEGYLLCNADKVTFSTCTGGKWTVPQPLGGKTSCVAGAGPGLTIINPS